jgi:hypothetical protein
MVEGHTITVRTRGDELWLEDDWWPARLLVDALLLETPARLAFPYGRYEDGRLIIELANGRAEYVMLGPSLTCGAYVLDCITCSRDLTDRFDG